MFIHTFHLYRNRVDHLHLLLGVAGRLSNTLVHARILIDNVLQRELAGRCGQAHAQSAQFGRDRIQVRPASQRTCVRQDATYMCRILVLGLVSEQTYRHQHVNDRHSWTIPAENLFARVHPVRHVGAYICTFTHTQKVACFPPSGVSACFCRSSLMCQNCR